MSVEQFLRGWWVLIPASLLLALSFWWATPTIKEQTTERDTNGPDAVMEHFSALKLNAQGRPEYVLSAEKMSYFNQNRAELTTPRFSFIPPIGLAPIHIVAARGTVQQVDYNIQFFDNVEVLREATNEQSELRIQTEYLQIKPNQNLVETNKAVRISDANSNINAVGFQFNQQTRTLNLLSQVRSQHVLKH